MKQVWNTINTIIRQTMQNREYITRDKTPKRILRKEITQRTEINAVINTSNNNELITLNTTMHLAALAASHCLTSTCSSLMVWRT